MSTHVPSIQPQVKSTAHEPAGRLVGWYATCSCGWRGEPRAPTRQGKASAKSESVYHATRIKS